MVKASLGAAVAAVALGGAAAIAMSSTSQSGGVAEDSAVQPQQISQNVDCPAPGGDSAHWYVEVYQCGLQDYKSISATLAMPKPPPKIDVEGGGTHSNAQITLEEVTSNKDPCGNPLQNAIEVSWVVSGPRATLNPLASTITPNDGKPFLQVGRYINGVPDYSKDWHPYPSPPEAPNYPQPLNIERDYLAQVSYGLTEASHSDVSETASGSLELKVLHVGNQWQVWVSGREIGYYLDSTWGSNGFHPRRAEWWGEVGSSVKSDVTGPSGCGQSSPASISNASCTAMGDGSLGGATAAFSKMATEGGASSLSGSCTSQTHTSILRTSSIKVEAVFSRLPETRSGMADLENARHQSPS